MAEPRPPPPSGGGSHGRAPSSADRIEDKRMRRPRPPSLPVADPVGGAPLLAGCEELRRPLSPPVRRRARSRACSRGGGAAPLPLLSGGWRGEGGAAGLQRWRGGRWLEQRGGASEANGTCGGRGRGGPQAGGGGAPSSLQGPATPRVARRRTADDIASRQARRPPAPLPPDRHRRHFLAALLPPPPAPPREQQRRFRARARGGGVPGVIGGGRDFPVAFPVTHCSHLSGKKLRQKDGAGDGVPQCG
jgi:hypothetical protein